MSIENNLTQQQIDTLYVQAHEAVREFQFDKSVAEVFPDMIERSIPGYQTILTGVGALTKVHAQENTNLYDLGCSLGAATLTMRRNVEGKNCEIIAIDKAQAMINRAKTYLHAYHSDVSTQLHCADMTTFPIKNASVVVMNFTLQFIDPNKRVNLLTKIYQGLKPGGILILSEKIYFQDETLQATIEHLHLQFKRKNGYSELEISQKRSALDKVLICDTQQVHLARFKTAGFKSSATWFQAYNFVSFIAIKS